MPRLKSEFIPHPKVERLMLDGSPHPEWLWRNLTEIGHTCPQRQFVELAYEIGPKEQAKIWGVPVGNIDRWKHAQRWKAIRTREWKPSLWNEWNGEAEAIVKLQKHEVQGQQRRWKRLRVMMEEMLSRGTTTEQTSTGEIFERELGIKDIKDAVTTLDLIDENISRTFGLSRALLKAGGDFDPNTPRVQTRIRTVRHNFTSVEEVLGVLEEKTSQLEERALE